MQKSRFITDNVEKEINNNKNEGSIELPSRGFDMNYFECSRMSTTVESVRTNTNSKRRVFEAKRVPAMAERRQKAEKMEWMYKYFCESESKDLEFIAAGLERLKIKK